MRQLKLIAGQFFGSFLLLLAFILSWEQGEAFQQHEFQQSASRVTTTTPFRETNWLPSPRIASISRNVKQKRQQTRTKSCQQRLDTTTALSSWTTAAASLSRMQCVLHRDKSFCLSAVLLLSFFGISLERRTLIGKALSAPLATMAVAITVANLGVVPFSSPIYSAVNSYLVPLAVPMLLFDSDLRRVLRDTGSLLTAFGVGAVATVVGTLLAYPLVPLRSLGIDGYKIACCLAARHIGGAINFVAVAETLKVSGTAVSAAIAADNVVVALYFAFLFALAKPGEPESTGKEDEQPSDGTERNQVTTIVADTVVNEETQQTTKAEMVVDPESVDNDSAFFSLPTLALSLCVSSALVTTGGVLSKAYLPAGTSALPLTSVLTVVAATVFPSFFAKIRSAGNALGVLFIQMFFAASGAAGSIWLVMEQAPSLFAFSLLQIAIHFVFLMGVGRRIFGLRPRELYLASNANVGGPTTAAAMAQAKEWKHLVLPALLIGILGYSTATAIALALGPILLKLPTLSF